MKFNFSVNELVVILSALRGEYRRCLEGAEIARRKMSTASTIAVEREFSEIAVSYEERCTQCEFLYKRIVDKNIVEEL